MTEKYNELFTRYPGNPILTSKDWPYDVNTVFNPAVTMYKGKVLILARVEDRRGISHFTKAISDDGITNWKIDKKPTMFPQPDKFPEEKWGIEDPRITWIGELSKWAITYTSFSQAGPLVSLAFTKDFVNFEKMGDIMPPEDKDAALFSRKFNGKWLLIHRPIGMKKEPGAHIWVSRSEDFEYWGDNKVLIHARQGGWWDANKIGITAPPLETEDGWLILYHGVKQTISGGIYRLGIALLDRDNPLKVLRRSDEWIFSPRKLYEREGDVRDVVFPCGWIWDKEKDEVKMYYGGADTCIAMATASMSKLLDYVKHCPKP